MPLLAYCMMEEAAQVKSPAVGVGGAPIDQLQDSRLRCFFSRFQSREKLSGIPAVESALAFHRVLQALLRQAVLIPFRFPTVVENDEQLREYLQVHTATHAQALARLRSMVQMEIHIATGPAPENSKPAPSGREYLQERQTRAAGLQAAAEKFRQVAHPWVTDWQQRRAGEGIRCYALLYRDAVAGFQEAAQELSRSLPGTRVSGPWPPSQFLELKDF